VTAHHKHPEARQPGGFPRWFSLLTEPFCRRENDVNTIGVGIDTARYGHRVTFLDEARQPAAPPLTIQETQQGYGCLADTLCRLQNKFPEATLRIRIDAAGHYAANLEAFLRKLPLQLQISLGQPKQNKDYQQVHFPKRKSDDTDSQAVARFAVVEAPPPTAGCSPEILALREVTSWLQSQGIDCTRAINQLHNLLARVFPELATIVKTLAGTGILHLLGKYPTPNDIARARIESLQRIPHIKPELAERLQQAARSSVASFRGEVAAQLVRHHVQQLKLRLKAKRQLERLLEATFAKIPSSACRQVATIPGIGTATAAALVAKIVDIDRFTTPNQLVGYFGCFPEEHSSGVDKAGRPLLSKTTRISPKGNDLVRHYLWMAAKCASLHNPAIRALYQRQRAAGKRGDVALGHCMRKLLHLVYAVWKTNRPFDPRHYAWEAGSSAVSATPQKVAESPKAERAAETEVISATITTVAAERLVDNSHRHKRPSPSIDYRYLRQQISIGEVLRLLNYPQPLTDAGTQVRGPCPLHHDRRHRSTFSVNLEKGIFQCFARECRAHGNVLELWAQAKGLTIHQAAFDLAEKLHLKLQWNREENP
jgi:transposase